MPHCRRESTAFSSIARRPAASRDIISTSSRALLNRARRTTTRARARPCRLADRRDAHHVRLPAPRATPPSPSPAPRGTPCSFTPTADPRLPSPAGSSARLARTPNSASSSFRRADPPPHRTPEPPHTPASIALEPLHSRPLTSPASGPRLFPPSLRRRRAGEAPVRGNGRGAASPGGHLLPRPGRRGESLHIFLSLSLLLPLLVDANGAFDRRRALRSVALNPPPSLRPRPRPSTLPRRPLAGQVDDSHGAVSHPRGAVRAEETSGGAS
jgi:hypothetical protein